MPASTLSASSRTRFGIDLAALVLVVLCCIVFVVKGFHDESLALNGFDFKPVYSGARCLLSHCSSYDSVDLRRAYIEGGGSDSDDRPFRPFNANYPPSALFWVTPFALLQWKTALFLWLSLSAALFVTAALLMANLCQTYRSPMTLILLGIFVASSTILMMLAQPAEPAIGLCVIAVWCLIKRKFPIVCVVCFALSLTLKPHLGGLVWLYFFLSGTYARRRAVQIFITTILFCLPGVLWAFMTPQMAHWPQDLSANLVGIAARGNASDPGPTNIEAPGIADLQAAVSVFRDDREFYNLISFAVGGGIVLIWAYVAVRAPESLKKDLLAVAAIAYSCLLPVYHRQYDTRLLLLAFPATAVLLAEGGVAGTFALLLSLATIAGTNHAYPRVMAQHMRISHTIMGPLETVLLARPIPVILLIGSLFYLGRFIRMLTSPRQ